MITPNQRARQIRILNAANEQSIDIEWEIALQYGLSQLGSIKSEVDFGGVSRADIHFASMDFDFIADIAAVNDKGYEKLNPLEEFKREFYQRVRKAGLRTNLFTYRIESEQYGGKTRLLLPRNNDWNRLFDQNFSKLLACAKLVLNKPVALRRQAEGIDVTFWYTPGQQYGGGSHPSYRSSSSLRKNPIYNTLKRKKEQLKASGFSGIRGIFLCDAACEQMRSPSRVINHFLAGTSSVAFVVDFTLDGDRFSKRRDGLRVTSRFYLNPRFRDDGKARLIRELLETQIIAALPNAADDPVNAINHLRWRNRRVGLSHDGGYSFWGGRYMRISSRALHELLAGKVSSDEFLKTHAFKDDGTGRMVCNPFLGALNEGRMIANIYVDRSDEEDDDWLVFEFTDPDAAISRFRTNRDTGTDEQSQPSGPTRA